ncbi:fructokinase [Bacteroidia bacterium]|nr:fructokinase [Bacteroidia bacterium]
MINTNRKVIGIGESIWDIIVQGNRPQKAVPGGSVFNCMVSLGRCEVPSVFVSELGNDPVGQIIRSFLKDNNLPSDHINFYDDGQTPVSLAFLNEKKDAEYLFYRDFPQRRLIKNFPTVNENDIVVFGSYFAVNPAIRRKVAGFLNYAKKQKAILYYDINIRKPHFAGRNKEHLDNAIIANFQRADIIRCSAEDLALIYPGWYLEDCIEHVFQYSQCVIVTQGSDKIILATPHFTKHYKVETLVPVSTIGAGDNFNAGFIYGMMKLFVCQNDIFLMPERPWTELIEYGIKFASEVCLSLDNYIPKDFARQFKFILPE